MAKKSIFTNIVIAVVAIAMGVGVGFIVPVEKKLRTLPESESIILMETTYKNGVPQDKAPAYTFIEKIHGPISEEGDEFFEGTEFKDLYLPSETVGLIAEWADQPTLYEFNFYAGMYNRWENIRKEFKKLKSYTYKLEEQTGLGYPEYHYSVVATGIKHDGTEGTFETYPLILAPKHMVIDKRG